MEEKRRLKYLDKYDFSYKDLSHEDVVKIINSELPIKLKYNEDLIDRISEKYPLLTKTQIAVIVVKTFETIREIFIRSDILNLSNFMCHSRFKFLKNKDKLTLKLFSLTPKNLKNYNE